jgi:hypothetical protein
VLSIFVWCSNHSGTSRAKSEYKNDLMFIFLIYPYRFRGLSQHLASQGSSQGVLKNVSELVHSPSVPAFISSERVSLASSRQEASTLGFHNSCTFSYNKWFFHSRVKGVCKSEITAQLFNCTLNLWWWYRGPSNEYKLIGEMMMDLSDLCL